MQMSTHACGNFWKAGITACLHNTHRSTVYLEVLEHTSLIMYMYKSVLTRSGVCSPTPCVCLSYIGVCISKLQVMCVCVECMQYTAQYEWVSDKVLGEATQQVRLVPYQPLDHSSACGGGQCVIRIYGDRMLFRFHL